ncbi:MAG: O-antigen ligase family protein [Clostridiales Family XIII bacterium]|jgi:O-antigen ligase|nr:O-antigen ligase family protein [Clostridiales Family XIII bacterium]
MQTQQGKLSSLRQRLDECQSAGDLMRLATQQTFDRCAFALLCFLTFIPVLIIPFYLFTDNANFMLTSANEPAFSNISMNISVQFFAMFDIAGNLSLILLVLYLIHEAVLRRPLNLKMQPWLIALIGVLIFSVIATLAAFDVGFAWRGSSYRHDGLYTYLHIAGAFGCAFMLKSKALKLCLLKLFCLSVSITCSISFFQLFEVQLILEKFTSSRASVFYQFNHFAYFLVMGITVSLLLMLLDTSKKTRIIAGVLAAIQIFTLANNNTFGGFLAVLAVSIFLPFFLTSVKKKFSVTYLLPVVMVLAITFASSLGSFLVNIEQLYRDSDNLTDNSGSGRWIMWKTAFWAITERPIIGYGPEGVAWVFESHGLTNDRPHNEVLQYAASIGIPGLICYLSALILLFRRFWQRRKYSDPVLLTAACVVIAYFVSSLVGNTMYYTTPFFFMFLGLVAGDPQIKTSS